jgi:hypothetical protein
MADGARRGQRCAFVSALICAVVGALARPALGSGKVSHPNREPQPQSPSSEPSLPAAAKVKLVLEPAKTRNEWTFRVVNLDRVPVRVVADARILTFDVTPLGARRAEHCALPSDMMPTDDLERAIVLPPNRTYSESFEPRLFCFSGRSAEALVADSIVVAHLGWTSKSPNGPHVLSPLDGVIPAVAPQARLDASPVSLPDDGLDAVSESSARDAEPDGARLSLEGPPTVDASSPDEIVIRLTLRNEGARAQNVRLRPDTLGFDVVRSSGTSQCPWPTLPAGPSRELFSTVSRGHPAHLDVLLGDFCVGHELDQPGLLVVWPWLDARAKEAPDLGFPTFSGTVSATKGVFVRLHRGRARAGGDALSSQ